MRPDTIHITIKPKGQLYEARLGEEVLTTSRTPFLSAARVLTERGHEADAILTMSHIREAGIALRSTIKAAAQLTVIENDVAGPRFGNYRPPPAEMPVPRVRGTAKTAGTKGEARAVSEVVGGAL
ncbi:hypothetical protein [Bosea sp. ANAM02]|uniref:hypothetical protein n=1 Tax=Bosea sp. ANAM02 TaxID=2020412 RepID=UPI00140F0564|nr:hypothetical protein [Bosea sp. ANAM02]BCB20054.1 hypothetical protein OCUBac02_29480 [Bosea sp. ANAM02]